MGVLAIGLATSCCIDTSKQAEFTASERAYKTYLKENHKQVMKFGTHAEDGEYFQFSCEVDEAINVGDSLQSVRGRDWVALEVIIKGN